MQRSPTARLLLLLLTATAALPAQRERAAKDAKAGVDPYTGGDPELMQAAGYVSFGPFPWADGHGTEDIRKAMPTVPVLFVETAHFKIGSSLPEIPLPKNSQRRTPLKKELAELERLMHDKTKVGADALRGKRRPTKARRLDPWLRLHLFAMRLERHYAAFQKVLRVDDSSFEPKALPLGQTTKKGQGPYLGMRGKFLILLLRKESNLQRYSVKVTGREQAKGGAHAHFFNQTGNILYGTHTELMDHRLSDDHSMHCHVIFCASQALVMGFKAYQFAVPAWVSQGLSQWFSHQLDPLEHTYRKMKDRLPGETFDPRWDFNVRGLVKNKGPIRPWPEAATVQHTHQLDFLDTLCSWSRVDFLLATYPEQFAAFFSRINDPLTPRPDGPPPFPDILAQQEQAVKEAFGKGFAELDEEWKAYVLRKYPRK